MSLNDWTSIAQIVIAAFTVIGVVMSLYFSRQALREVQKDRRQRQKPHLAFERGGYQYSVKFVKGGKYIPGVNPRAAERLLAELPEDAESVRLIEKEYEDGSIDPVHIGRLKNYGQGPALTTFVTWIPHEIWIGNESFKIDEEKILEPIYSPGINTMPAIPSHMQPDEESGLPRFPVFIEKDVDKKISRVDGVLAIKAVDVFEKNHVFLQEFSIFPQYKENEPHVHITFGELVINE